MHEMSKAYAPPSCVGDGSVADDDSTGQLIARRPMGVWDDAEQAAATLLTRVA